MKAVESGDGAAGPAARATAAKRPAKHGGWMAASLWLCLVWHGIAQPQDLDVSLRADVARRQTGQKSLRDSSAGVVVWLTPEQRVERPPALSAAPQYTLAQKDKQFSPHLLVVPTGSTVDFPNLDPFFHNVFSLFNGKRFDLGLYEAHTRRAVRFDREGVSYIFCNIHPEMGAVIVSLSTPYFGVSARDGSVVIHSVPPGGYRLNVWAENVSPERLNALMRLVEISPRNMNLGTLSVETSGDLMSHHLNKFGEKYNPAADEPY